MNSLLGIRHEEAMQLKTSSAMLSSCAQQNGRCTLAEPGIHGHMVSYVEILVGRQVRGEGPRTLCVGCNSENSSWGQSHTQRDDIGHDSSACICG